MGAECSLWGLLLAVGASAIFVSFFRSRQLLLFSSASSGLVSLAASAFGLVEVGLAEISNWRRPGVAEISKGSFFKGRSRKIREDKVTADQGASRLPPPPNPPRYFGGASRPPGGLGRA